MKSSAEMLLRIWLTMPSPTPPATAAKAESVKVDRRNAKLTKAPMLQAT